MLFFQSQSMKTVHPNEKNVFVMHNHKKNGDYHESPSFSHLMMNFNSKKVEIKAFLAKPMHENRAS